MGFMGNVYFGNTLLNMYAKYDHASDARKLFDEMIQRDVVTWTCMISGYIQVGNFAESFRLFNEMDHDSVLPNEVTIATILRACGIVEIMCILCFAIKRGHESYELVQNSALMALNRLDSFECMIKLFSSIRMKSIVSWNIILSGYASKGEPLKVVKCFESLRAELKPTHETLTQAMSALGKLGNFSQGQKLHCVAVKSGQMDAVFQACLVDFYAKCNKLLSSLLLFDEAKANNKYVWCAMILGYIQNGQFENAIDSFKEMQELGYEPNVDTLKSVVLACTELGALQYGKTIHGYLTRNILSNDFCKKTLDTSMLNLYARCGDIALARKYFNTIVHKDVVLWSSMIDAYGIHGLGLEALKLHGDMQQCGIRPNSITFLNLLSACGHTGLVNEGRNLFHSMSRTYMIEPELMHYTCMVDLLGRCGKLSEALGLINIMKCQPDARIWGALLASCRIHSDDELGNYAARKLLDLESDNVGYHVILSNIEASEGKWESAERIRNDLSGRKIKKKPGWSCVEEKGRLTMFVASDLSHPNRDEIYKVLHCLIEHAEAQLQR